MRTHIRLQLQLDNFLLLTYSNFEITLIIPHHNYKLVSFVKVISFI